MNPVRVVFFACACLLLASCASLQVERDLKHHAAIEAYRGRIVASDALELAPRCAPADASGSWITMDFDEQTPVLMLPSGMTVAAYCVGVPAGAKAVELRSGSKGGLTYHELTLIHPSIQFLDSRFELIKDLVKPRMLPSEFFFSGLGLSGITVLTPELGAAKHIVVYVHPASFDGSVEVQTGYEAIPVPYGPLGQVRVRFH